MQTRGGGALEGWVFASPPYSLLSLTTPTVVRGAGPGEVGMGEGNLGRRLLHGVGRDC